MTVIEKDFGLRRISRMCKAELIQLIGEKRASEIIENFEGVSELSKPIDIQLYKVMQIIFTNERSLAGSCNNLRMKLIYHFEQKKLYKIFRKIKKKQRRLILKRFINTIERQRKKFRAFSSTDCKRGS